MRQETRIGVGALGVALVLSTFSLLPAGAAGSWTVVPSPTPVGVSFVNLKGVSCTAAVSCTAVGYSSNGTLIEQSNGTAWTIVPGPSSSPSGALNAVSCTAATDCTAVGSLASGSGVSVGTATLVERWNGTAWTIVPSPNPAGARFSELFGVSCTAATFCVAVGRSSSATASSTLVEQWNGMAWTIVAHPSPAGAELDGVSCTAATACTAVGSSGTGSPPVITTLVEQWNGTAWTIVASPNPAGAKNTLLKAVSCTSASNCFAVGNASSATAAMTLVERWNGTAWTIVASPSPAGATDSELLGVACTAGASSCVAVGVSGNGQGEGHTTLLVEQWNGTTWTIAANANPPGATSSALNGVSCTGTTSCSIAVGFSGNGTTSSTLIESSGTGNGAVGTTTTVSITTTVRPALAFTGQAAEIPLGVAAGLIILMLGARQLRRRIDS